MRRSRGFFRRLIGDEAGNFAMILAIAAIPLLGLVGLGVDVTRAYIAKARLQGAVDAAALAAAGLKGQNEDLIRDVTSKYFYSNYAADYWAPPAAPLITMVNDTVLVSARANVQNYFFGFIAADHEIVATAAEALSEIRGLEVVLVLDVTSSMVEDNMRATKLDAMKKSALELVDILFAANKDPGKLKIALVPYNAAVNIGTNMSAFVANTGSPAYFPNTDWAGCVMARRPSDNSDVKDVYTGASDVGGRGKWVAYRWPVEANQRAAGEKADKYCINRAASLTGAPARAVGFIGTAADNAAPQTSEVDKDGRVHNRTIDMMTERRYVSDSRGPNMSCPQPVLPLSADKAEITSRINALDVVYHGGTITAEGAAWGLRLISHDAPFTDGVPYGEPGWDKVIIILTDGEQILGGDEATGAYPAWDCMSDPADVSKQTDVINDKAWTIDPANYGAFGNKLQGKGRTYDWSAYGYVADMWPFGQAASKPLPDGRISGLESRLSAACNEIKNTTKPDNTPAINLYTITFGTEFKAGAVKDLMRRCASSESNYFNAPTNEELSDVFTEIAHRLSSTRLTK